MTHEADLTAREAEIIRAIRILSPHARRFIVVGGYAVNALGLHRFSVDCDIVIAETDLGLFERILTREGYDRDKPARPFSGLYGAQTVEYTKLIGNRRVSVDLFVNSVMCRQTGGEWGYSLIRKHSIEANVVGLSDSAVAFVPKRELLMAMKIHSGRDADLGDLIMLSEGADWEAVGKFTTCGEKEKVIHQLNTAVETIGKPEFPSSLTAEFSLRSDVAPLIKSTWNGLKKVAILLSAEWN